MGFNSAFKGLISYIQVYRRTLAHAILISLCRYSDSLRAGRFGDQIPVRRGRDFRTRPDRPWDSPSLLYNGYRVFPGGKADGAWR